MSYELYVMFSFLHNFHPAPILLALGPIQIHWYGLFITLGALAAIGIMLKLAGYYEIKKQAMIDLAFWLIIFGLIGARLYHVLLEWPYYLSQPLDVVKIWQGGLAIHGGIIAGVITLWFYSKKHQLNFWQITAIIAPGLALAQAIGRWGNYFNQELFGRPTSLPWGIPIDAINRPLAYLNYDYFHPTFLYESVGNFLIFITLILIHVYILKKIAQERVASVTSYELRVMNYALCVMSYAILYSLLRFFMEFLRIDQTPTILGLRFPQWASLIIIFICLGGLVYKKMAKVRINFRS